MSYVLDLDGTLVDGGQALPGAVDLVAALNRDAVPFVVMTNSVRSPLRVNRELADLGMNVSVSSIINPLVSLNRTVALRGARRVWAIGTEAETSQLEVPVVTEAPDLIVLLDFERLGGDYGLLQSLLEHLDRGVPAVTASRSLTYGRAGHRRLDTGSFVELLERASGRTIENVGKPSQAAFATAVALLGVPADQVTVVGDDGATDVIGGRAAGCRTVLVRTGKYRPGDEERWLPDRTVDELSGLQ